MDVPAVVRRELGEEEPLARVSLGGTDQVVVTATRTIVYRADGLIRDESAESFPHDCDRIDLSEGRRKATLRFHYIEGPKEFSVPSDRLDDVLEHVLRGVLTESGVVEPDESVESAYRFSDLTLVITDARLVKYVGGSLWDADYETYPYDGLTGLAFEQGSIATEIAIESEGRPERIKTPNEQARLVQRDLERAVFEFHGVDSLEALNAAVAPDDGNDDGDAVPADRAEGINPLLDDDTTGRPDRAPAPDAGDGDGDDTGDGDANGTDRHDGAEAFSMDEQPRAVEPDRGGEESGADDAVADRLAELTAAVERQNELLERQQDTIEQLVEELRRGR
jgi:hypothetical protein